jgi:spermidine synthase
VALGHAQDRRARNNPAEKSPLAARPWSGRLSRRAIAQLIYLPTIFLSAILLFLVQSILGKHLLPWFGGTPSVWATCMLFFQTVLLAGYAYVWALDRWLTPARQKWMHLGLLAAALGSVAWGWAASGSLLLPGSQWKPRGDESPVLLILACLAASVGLAFFALSTTAPLVQRWFSLTSPGAAPWRLYALSNAGSLLGLLAFPFVLEPRWPLPVLATVWAGLFLLFALASGACTIRVPTGSKSAPHPNVETAGESAPAPAPADRWLWLLLATTTSALFLATTNQLCQEVAVVPLLWVLPLAIYLVTFILCFERARWYARRWMVPVAVVATLAALLCAFLGVQLSIPAQIAGHVLLLFFFCMVCHGELARLKPSPRHLAAFYLILALGGALGGAAVSLGAPLVLARVSEFHIALLGGWIVLAFVFARDKRSFFFTGDRWHFHLLVFLLGAAAWRAVAVFLPADVPGWARGWAAPLLAGLVVAGAVGLVSRRRDFPSSRLWPRALTAIVIFTAELFMLDRMRSAGGSEVVAARNFFGAVRIHKLAPNNVLLVQLTHGQINHGFQYLDNKLYRQPAGYCNPDSGAGLAFTRHPRRDHANGGKKAQPMRVGIAGLGVGAMAAYGREGDLFRFYEINPLVIAYAAGPKPYFTYLQDTPAKVETVLGDARLALERELETAGGQQFDILLLDAFSSDSVPVHLLTVEAFRCYRRHLRDSDSLIAVNISNRFIDFRPLLFSVADHFGLQARVFYNHGNPPVPTASLWVLLGRRGHPLLQIELPDDEFLAPVTAARVLWTDAHSDVFRLVNWTQRTRRHYFLIPIK